MAFLAATKQLMSDLEVPVASLFYVRSSHLVTIGLLLVFVLSLFLGPCTFLFGFFGLVSGWIYLRFFQRKACGIVGDASSVFAFHTFFPEVLQGPIKACEDFVCKLKAAPMFRRFHSASDSTKGANEFDGHITIKVNPVDAERRKQIALNAVNEKLSEDTTV